MLTLALHILKYGSKFMPVMDLNSMHLPVDCSSWLQTCDHET